MRILVVEDNADLRSFLQRGLSEEGFSADVAADGDDALFRLRTEPYQVVVLDWMLPGKSGLDVLTELRSEGNCIPVLMLTANDEVQCVVTGLNSGADDYLTKPFKFEILLARIHALARRSPAGTLSTILRFDDLSLDLINHRAKWKDHPLNLLPKEEAVLQCFLRHPNRVLSRTSIYEQAWGDALDSLSNTLEVHVKELRRKLQAVGAPPIIHTQRGRGYVLARENEQ